MKICFIHINKTGGTSIKTCLGLPMEHKTALQKISELGLAEWQRRLTFCVVRNPWDKVLSHYYWRVRTNQTELGSRPISFSSWVYASYGNQDPFYYDKPMMFMPQLDWISDRHDKVLVKKILRFERLAEDFGEICDLIGRADLQFPHLKPTDHDHYRIYYDDATRDIVANWFRKDIKVFAYSF